MVLNEKKLFFAAISFFFALVLVATGVFFYWNYYVKKQQPATNEPNVSLTAQEQLEELDNLRRQSGVKALTEEETNQQMKELDKLKGDNTLPPDYSAQLEELDALRFSANN